jgi:hypothetical protein
VPDFGEGGDHVHAADEYSPHRACSDRRRVLDSVAVESEDTNFREIAFKSHVLVCRPLHQELGDVRVRVEGLLVEANPGQSKLPDDTGVNLVWKEDEQVTTRSEVHAVAFGTGRHQSGRLCQLDEVFGNVVSLSP